MRGPWTVTVQNGMARKVYRTGHAPRPGMYPDMTLVEVVPCDDLAVERAARALCKLDNEREHRSYTGVGKPPVDLRFEDWREEFLEQARAVLGAAGTLP